MKKYVIILLLLSINCIAAFAQDGITVSGTVKDANSDEALIGVTVQVANSTTGTTSDFDGNYSITIPSQRATLIFSYMGYKAKEVNVSKSGTVNVTLEQDAFVLDEIVAIGYGTMKRSDLTGSVSSISGDKLKIAPVAGVDQALQGRIAGVTVNANSGQPGAAASIRIRGIGTVNDANPLFVVDGVMVDNIDFLSTGDIQSTEVLKDASATAIYGSRGANGVILITTKKGNTDGVANITYETYVGWQSRWKKLDLMNKDQFVRIKSQFMGTEDQLQNYFANGDSNEFNTWIQNNFTGRTSIYFPQIKTDINPNGFDYATTDTDWQDEVFKKNAFMQNHYLSVDGGNKTSTYAISANYFDQEGTMMGSYYKRLTLRANSAHKVREWLKIGENLSFTNSESRTSPNNDANYSIISSALSMAPWDPTHYPDGTRSYIPRNNPEYPNGRDLSNQISASSNFKNVRNPFSMVYNSHPKQTWKRWVGDVFFEFTPLEGFMLRGDASMDLSTGNKREYKNKHEYSSYDLDVKNFFTGSIEEYKTFTYELTASYVRKFGKHDINTVIGATREDRSRYELSGSGASTEDLPENKWNLSNVKEEVTAGEGFDKSRRISFLGRLHYVYSDRYLATFSIRRDGSSVFPESDKWGTFPSTAFAWRISEEPFFQPFKDKFDMLKLRLGWGRIGNDKTGSSTSFMPVMSSTGPTFIDYVFGKDQQLASGATMLNYPGPGKWETTEQWNIGLDFSTVKGKLYGNIDFFLKDTKDMLMSVLPPAHVGYRYAIMANAGTVRNKGIELSLEYRDKISDFQYSIAGNMSMIDNELTKLNGGDKIWAQGNRSLSDEGYGLFTFWGYEYDGVFKSEEDVKSYVNDKGEQMTQFGLVPKPGDARFRDVNGDGKVDADDKTDIGNPFPWLTYGFNATLNYKNFDLQLFFQGVHGNKIFNAVRQLKTEGYGDVSVLSTAMNDVWSESNPNGSIPRPAPLGSSMNSENSSRYVESGSYFRLKNIQLGYTIPTHILKPAKIQSLRIYVAASNLFTITDYTGYDPEVGSYGVDYGNYPQSRTYMLGAKINF